MLIVTFTAGMTAIVGLMLWLYLRSAPEPLLLHGEPVIGCLGTISVAVPARKVGAVTLEFQGRRVRRACTHELGIPLSVGTPVRVVDVRRGLLVVEWA